MVFDINKASTFHSAINKWYDMARAKCPDASFMLIGNKIDLTSNIDQAEATRWAKMNNVLYMKTSVKEGINVQMCFEKLAEIIINKPLPKKAESFTLRKGVDVEKKKDKKCC